jgi:propanol-preferring alcohol dehydrogenase
MGFRTVALSSGRDKEALARQLGAHVYVDGATADAAQELRKLGGARVILATAPSSRAIAPLVGGLAARGELMIIGAAADPLPIMPIQLIGTARTIRGWPSGTSIDSEDTLRFCALTGIRPMIEKFPLDRAAEAFDRMVTNKVRFRAVLSRT